MNQNSDAIGGVFESFLHLSLAHSVLMCFLDPTVFLYVFFSNLFVFLAMYFVIMVNQNCTGREEIHVK